MPAADAVLQDEQGRSVLRFERVLSHPPETVWDSVVDKDRQAAWHPSPFEFEPEPGGSVRFDPLPNGHEMPEGEVTEYDPPRVLAHTWGEDVVRYEVRPHDDGAVLILTHTFDDRFKAARDAAGWHGCLTALESALGGAPDEEAREHLSQGWQELNGAYQEKFGIPPEKATPPPGG